MQRHCYKDEASITSMLSDTTETGGVIGQSANYNRESFYSISTYLVAVTVHR